jgi:hypothetical protein
MRVATETNTFGMEKSAACLGKETTPCRTSANPLRLQQSDDGKSHGLSEKGDQHPGGLRTEREAWAAMSESPQPLRHFAEHFRNVAKWLGEVSEPPEELPSVAGRWVRLRGQSAGVLEKSPRPPKD